MADNYLEKKMEEHRRARSGTSAAKIRDFRDGYARFKTDIDSCLIDLCDDTCGAAGESLKLFGSTFRHTYVCGTIEQARKPAQACGARHYPYDRQTAINMLKQEGVVPDALIYTEKEALIVEILGNRCRIIPSKSTSKETYVLSAARLALFITLPDASSRRDSTFVILPDGKSSEIIDASVES